MENLKIKKGFLVYAYFAIFVTGLLSLFASNNDIRQHDGYELQNHISAVWGAKQALENGQFPPRTTPFLEKNFGNAFTQFYAPVLYTVSGLLNQYFFPKNPFLALKSVLWASLLLGMIYFYHLIDFLIKSRHIAVLSATVYVTAPYILVNIFGLGHIPESVAQGIIPVILYYSFKIYFVEEINIKLIFISSIFWFVLLGTHPITFFYFSLFFALFLVLIGVLSKIKIKKFFFIGISYIYGIILGLYYFVPTLKYATFTNIGDHIHFIYYKFATFLTTSLSTLLSFSAASPMPLPANHWIGEGSKIYISLGLPTEIGFCLGIYSLICKRSIWFNEVKKFLFPALLCFFLVFLAVWTPVYDVWNLFPTIFQIGQFTYRFMSQVMWIGTICFALSLYIFFKNNIRLKHTIVFLFLIVISSQSWFIQFNEKQSQISIETIITNPILHGATDAYLMNPDKIKTAKELHLTDSFVLPECVWHHKKTLCEVTIGKDLVTMVLLPVFFYPNMLDIKVNGKKVSYFPLKVSSIFRSEIKSPFMLLVGLTLPEGTYKIESYFIGLSWANYVSVAAFLFLFIFFIFDFLIKKIRQSM